MQVLVDAYAKKKSGDWIASKVGRSPRAIYIAMCRYRRKARADPRKREVIYWLKKAMAVGVSPGKAITAIRRAKVFGEMEEDKRDIQF